MKYFLIIFGIIIFIILIYIMIMNKKRKSLYNEQVVLKNDLDKSINSIKTNLIRVEEISRNEEVENLFQMWTNDFNKQNKKYEEYLELYDELELENKGLNKRFFQIVEQIDENFFDLLENIETLENKIQHFTEFEIDNSKIALSLKSFLKEIKNNYDINLRMYDVYNESFNNVVAEAQVMIVEFENLQKAGEYTKGRKILKDCSVDVENIELITNSLISQHKALIDIDNVLSLIKKIVLEIQNIGYKLHLDDYDEIMTEFSLRKKSIFDEVKKIKYVNNIENLVLDKNKNDIEILGLEITEFKNEVSKQYNLIKEIKDLENTNKEFSNQIEELLQLSIEECSIIEEKYNLKTTNEIISIQDINEEYQKFKNDYEKLLNIIHEGKENHEQMINRITKANKFLQKIINNIKKDVLKLKAIRQDEFDGRKILDMCNNDLVEIDLYLRRNDHYDKLSLNLKNTLKEINEKRKVLAIELDKEQIDINQVRNLMQYIEVNLQNLKEHGIERNIKQRIGAQKLIRYIARFNRNAKINQIIKNMNAYYAANNYESVLEESQKGLQLIVPTKYDKVYRAILTNIEVEEFNKILK